MDFSIKDIKSKIPNEALNDLEASFPPHIVRGIYEAMRRKRIPSFRINPLKGDRTAIVTQLKKESLKFKDVPGLPYAFQIEGKEKDLQGTSCYRDGQLYLQGLSGMLSPIVLAPKPGDHVLDMAAAPGSKSTMLAALMENSGILDLIEPDFIRMERLKHNCNILGANNVRFHQTRAEKFRADESEIYHAILADVPCSGEGRFNLFDPPSYLSWRSKEIAKFAKLQKKILSNGLRLLKEGGRMLYSTCTLNREENENVILQLLEEYPGQISCLEINHNEFKFPELIKLHEGKLRALRIIPSERFEGFFLCLLQKKKMS